MKRSAIPDRILQQLDDVIGVWEENPSLSMGPDVTIEKFKATRVQLDACVIDVQTINRALTKQRRPRRLRQPRQRVCGAGAQGHPGLLRSRFHAIRPGRRHPPE